MLRVSKGTESLWNFSSCVVNQRDVKHRFFWPLIWAPAQPVLLRSVPAAAGNVMEISFAPGWFPSTLGSVTVSVFIAQLSEPLLAKPAPFYLRICNLAICIWQYLTRTGRKWIELGKGGEPERFVIKLRILFVFVLLAGFLKYLVFLKGGIWRFTCYLCVSECERALLMWTAAAQRSISCAAARWR